MNKRRKARHIISGLLVFLMALSAAITFLFMFFYFGVFNQAVLIRSFERSLYYNEQCDRMEREARQSMEAAGVQEELLDPSAYRASLERKMRSQVYGRHDKISELSELAIAEEMLERLSRQGIEPTLRAQQGILKLADQVGDIFAKGTVVPGILEWRREKERFEDQAAVPLFLFAGVFVILACIFFLIQSRKYLFVQGVSVAVLLATAFGLAGGAAVLRFSWETCSVLESDLGRMAKVVVEYQKGVFDAGLKICVGALFVGIALLLCGQIFKKSFGNK